MSNISGAVPDRYPVSCPSCASVAGVPVAVMTVADHPRSLQIDFSCHECDHRWRRQFEDQFRIFPPAAA